VKTVALPVIISETDVSIYGIYSDPYVLVNFFVGFNVFKETVFAFLKSSSVTQSLLMKSF